MPNPTTNFGWVTPDVGGSRNVWGSLLNALFDEVDADLQTAYDDVVTAQATADAALPKAGGTVTGRVDGHTSTLKAHIIGNRGTDIALDLATYNFFQLTPTADIVITFANAPDVANTIVAFLVQIVNAGAFVPTFGGTIKWPAGTAPVGFSAAGKDLFLFVGVRAGVAIAEWNASQVQRDVR